MIKHFIMISKKKQITKNDGFDQVVSAAGMFINPEGLKHYAIRQV